MHSGSPSSAALRRLSLPHAAHMQYTAAHKQSILSHYRAGVKGAGFDALARRFAVKGGGAVIKRWHDRWNRDAASLEHKQGAGRPRALSGREVQQYVRAPILRANRAHRAVRYTELLPAVQERTGKNVSVRTLRRYGKEKLGARSTRGKKRTAEECECTDTRERE